MSAVWGWSKVECTPDGGAPCQRSLHAAAVLNDSIYIFGGAETCRVWSFAVGVTSNIDYTASTDFVRSFFKSALTSFIHRLCVVFASEAR